MTVSQNVIEILKKSFFGQMNLLPLSPIFHRLNREHFGGTLAEGVNSKLDIRWSDGRMTSTAGCYRTKHVMGLRLNSEIVLSRPVLGNLPERALVSTLCHEMIHAWIDLVVGEREAGHGKLFHDRMALINASQNDFEVTVRHSFPIPHKSPKWLAMCPKCGREFRYKRLVKGAACKSCCDEHFEGRWNKNCLLTYELIQLNS